MEIAWHGIRRGGGGGEEGAHTIQLLQIHPAAHSPKVVAQMKTSSWLNAAQDSFSAHPMLFDVHAVPGLDVQALFSGLSMQPFDWILMDL